MPIETQFAHRLAIEARIHVETGTRDRETACFEVGKDLTQLGTQFKLVVVIARHDLGSGNNKAVLSAHGQNITGFGAFAPLVGDRLAPFLAMVCVPSRLSSDISKLARIAATLLSNSCFRLPSAPHLRK